jgi:choline dehydrogenase
MLARARGSTIFHPSGTCMMGQRQPHGRGRPRAVRPGPLGLRVADASTMPTVVSGNTNAGCIMIGEKCAEMMLAAR